MTARRLCLVACIAWLTGCGGKEKGDDTGSAPTSSSTSTTTPSSSTTTSTTTNSSSTTSTTATTTTPTTDTSTTTSTSTAGVPATLDPHGVVVCADPAARTEQPYDRRAAPSPASTDGNWLWGGGVMVGEFDGDGQLDIVAPAEPYAKLYHTRTDGLFDEDDHLIDDHELSYGAGGTVVDYDGDGHLDLYVLRYDEPNRLLRNDGTGHFEDVTATAGVGSPGPATTSSWADYDGDGDLDLFVGNYGYPDQTGDVPTADFGPAHRSYLYRNDGGTFVEVGEDLLPQNLHDGYTYAGGFVDIDDDGWMDLYTVNDFGPAFANVLMMNEYGTLVPDEHAHGLDLQMTGMGLGIGDVNGDGLPEFLVPEYEKISYLRSSGGIWFEASAVAGIRLDEERGQLIGWGAEFADLDNDGDLDAPVAFGHIGTTHPNWNNPELQPDALWLNDGTGSFTDVAPSWGVDDTGSSRGFVAVDLNGDGFLDLAKRDIDGPDVVHLSRCDDTAWLIVRPHAPSPNTFAVGAKITIEANGQTQSRVIRAGASSYASGGPPEAHFGLGDADVVDRLTIRWPDRTESVFTDIDARQVIDLTRL